MSSQTILSCSRLPTTTVIIYHVRCDCETATFLTVSDGAGRWRSARFGDLLEAVGPVHEVAPLEYELSLAVALTKAAKPEFAVQKATELGINQIIVFQATHSIVRWDTQKQERALVRLGRVAREAAMQSRQVSIPRVSMAKDLAALASTQTVVRADFGGIPIHSGHRLVAIGPEGGWAEDEIVAVPETVDLGPSVLRAETAALVSAAQMIGLRPPNR